MMSERYDQDAILAYVEGEMPDELRRDFERRLEADDALRQLVGDLVGDRAGLRALGATRAPGGLIDAAVGHLERRMLLDSDAVGEASTIITGPIPIRAAPRKRWSGGRLFAYGAVAAMAAVSGAVMWQTLVVPPEPALPPFADAGDAAPRIAPATPPPAEAPETLAFLDESSDGTLSLRREASAPARTDGRAEVAAAAASEPAAPALPSPSPEGEPPLIEPAATLAGAGEARERRDAGGVVARGVLTEDNYAFAMQPLEAQPPEEPSWRVTVAARDPRAAETHVLRWAIRNGATILPVESESLGVASQPAAPGGGGGGGGATDGDAASGASGASGASEAAKMTGERTPAPPRQAVIVEMAESQVDALVYYLNNNGDQVAALEPTTTGSRSNAVDSLAANAVMMKQSPAPPPPQKSADRPFHLGFQLQDHLETDAEADASAARPQPPPPLLLDWSNILRTHVPLVPVERHMPVDPAVLPPRRVNVLVELNHAEPTE